MRVCVCVRACVCVSYWWTQGFLMGQPERMRPLERPTCRWEDNIEMDCRELGWGNMDWIDLAQSKDRCRAVVNAVINLRVP